MTLDMDHLNTEQRVVTGGAQGAWSRDGGNYGGF